MKQLRTLRKRIAFRCQQGSLEAEISGITYDSRKVQPQNVFVCIRGSRTDGHAYAQEAVKRGAAVLVAERELEGIPETVTVLVVKDSREALAQLSCAWEDDPAQHLVMIGVTGTKGKTTTAYMIYEILREAGIRAGLIGTIETRIGAKSIPAENTTPEPAALQNLFSAMVREGCTHVVMEVSSQAEKQHRCDGFIFDYGVFTNIGNDHIGTGEHASFAEYLSCKKKLLCSCRTGIVNRDEKKFPEIIQGSTCRLVTFGCRTEADFMAADAALYQEAGVLGVSCRVQGAAKFPVRVDLPGLFSVSNSLAAIAVCAQMGIKERAMQEALSTIRVRGRCEAVPVFPEITLLIDYAHNAMSLESLLTTLREYHPKRLICLFGCGGNRARDRRFQMGEVSGRLADLTVITSDNPREEEPQAIIDDIRTGIEKTNGAFFEIADRKEAIRFVIENRQPGDLIVLAGKGHETYQIRKGKRYEMDERVLIREILEESKQRK
ncbi:UDP-N-acetylmuramoyl-L-alanyl-D-glutamate--2,6-diaminopimelate ligase [Fusicatenibacter sp.]